MQNLPSVEETYGSRIPQEWFVGKRVYNANWDLKIIHFHHLGPKLWATFGFLTIRSGGFALRAGETNLVILNRILVQLGTFPSFMTSVDLHVTAGAAHVSQPLIWKLIREFNVRVNITKANVDKDFGWLELNLEGPVEEIQRATAWLMTTGVHVEAQQRAVGA